MAKSSMRAPAGAEISKIAQQALGYRKLRPGQDEAIRNLLNGRDVLVVQPTGSGKSAIYQIAGMLIEGITVIISPLIALQKDQVDSINDSGLADAAAVNSHNRKAELEQTIEKLERGDLEYIFLAPEQLQREETRERLRANPPSLFVIDEAHCISEWGHDFRPDYLQVGRTIEELKHPTVLALTATAAPEVRDEIIAGLGMRDPKVIIRGFDRPNIFLRVDQFPTEKEKQEALLRRIQFAEKPGLVYVATRKHAESIAQALTGVGVDAAWYHGGMPARERETIQQAFMDSNSQVMVATNAFGLGIDKPNIRFVYHYDIPDSIDSYYQEVGRAGRDGQPSEAVLFYRPEDLRIPKFLKSGGKVEEEDVLKVEQVLQRADEPVPIEDVRYATNLSTRKLAKAVNRLEGVGAVERLPTGEAVLTPNADLQEAARDVEEEESRLRERNALRLEKMRTYAELRDCRREYLLEYFADEDIVAPCRHCDNCESLGLKIAQESTRTKPMTSLPFPVHTRVTHQKFGKGVIALAPSADTNS